MESQTEMLYNRIQKRFRHLKKWARRVGTDAFRLYDRDIPEIPLVLDLYGKGVSGALYERPYEKDEAEEHRWLHDMAAAISAALEIPLAQVFLKQRKRQRGTAQYDKLRDRHFTQDVHEGGLVFRVNLSDYLDTGLFLDARRMRALVRAEATGKKVLNLFCYTAAFSVHAAAGGAAEVDSVDLSNTYLDWAAVNFGLNHYGAVKIDPGVRYRNTALPPLRLISRDVLCFLSEAAQARLSWDIIILDPPVFSNSKKMTSTLDVRRDHQGLISQCLNLLTLGGTLWFRINARHFRLNPEDFPGVDLRDMQSHTMDEDFKGKRLSPCVRLSCR
ncbi:MAG: class I SAM-dependent methyltransferase [Treponema sp.]|jgi:23S rRNA G2069 N7-methylase RlmK/C1962 C5-methylase RlmI|nr:class I SAM-dependent methyltransferase [Treponema sp.]